MTRSPPSIRTRALGMLAAVTLPLAGLGIYSGVRAYRETVVRADDRVLGVAASRGAALRELGAVAESVTRSLAERRGAELLDPEACARLAGPLAHGAPFFSDVFVVDAGGSPVCSARAADGPRAPAAGSAWFRTIRERGGFVVSEPEVDPLAGEWVVVAAYPIADAAGTTRGAMTGTLPVARIEEALIGEGLGADEIAAIATRDGVVVARSVDPELWVGRRAASATVEVEERGRSAYVTRATDDAGLARIRGHVDLPGVGWSVEVDVPARRVEGPGLASLRKAALLGAFLLGGGLTVALLLFRNLTGSMARLVERLRTAEADEAVEVPPGFPREVGEIVAAFDRTLRERTEAREAERTARERLRDIIENVVFGIYVATPDGRFVGVNRALVKMLGYDSEEELIEVGPRALYRDPEVRDRYVERYLGQGIVEDVELDWVRKDGRPIRVRLSGKTVRVPGGEPAFEMIVEDVTERRALEELTRHQQKMEAVGRLAGGVAHEFNNLLTVLGVNSEMIREAFEPGHPLRSEADEIHDALERARTLTRKLLAFSRKEVTRPRLLDVNTVVTGLEGMLRRVLGGAVRLDTDLASAPGTVRIDPGHLEQVILNLVVNARDALGHGGGAIRLRTSVRARRAIGDRGAPGDGPARWYAVLTVSDDGPGMDATVAKLAFEPFFTTKPPGVGTGLGLPTVYGIVVEAGGTIALDTAPGAGASFHVWLPAVTEAAEDGAPAVPTGNRWTVLVAAVDPALVTLAREALASAGFVVLEGTGVHEALDAYWRNPVPVDLLVTEVDLPAVSGAHLAVHLRGEQPDLPVVFLSDRPLGELPGGGHRSDVLFTPFDARQIGDACRRRLDPAEAGSLP